MLLVYKEGAMKTPRNEYFLANTTCVIPTCIRALMLSVFLRTRLLFPPSWPRAPNTAPGQPPLHIMELGLLAQFCLLQLIEVKVSANIWGETPTFKKKNK